jgi:hypothetical protein
VVEVNGGVSGVEVRVMSDAKLKKARRYLKPYMINSNTWFYKNRNSFDFHADVAGHHVSFTVQNRTLLRYLRHQVKEKSYS